MSIKLSTYNERVRRGQCLCGSVQYEVVGDPRIVAHCHCEDCQRLTGTGHSTGAVFPESKFQLNGPVSVFKLQSENGNEVTRAFCPSCGSPIFGRNLGMQGFVTVSLGTLDDSSDLKSDVAVFARNRKPWDVMGEDVETFDAQPAWKPEDSA